MILLRHSVPVSVCSLLCATNRLPVAGRLSVPRRICSRCWCCAHKGCHTIEVAHINLELKEKNGVRFLNTCSEYNCTGPSLLATCFTRRIVLLPSQSKQNLASIAFTFTDVSLIHTRFERASEFSMCSCVEFKVTLHLAIHYSGWESLSRACLSASTPDAPSCLRRS